MKTTVTLLPFVSEARRQELLSSLEAAGDYLQSVRMPAQYNWVQAWTVERVAKVDLEWAKRMFLESDWRGASGGGNEIVREIARTDLEEALRLYEDRFTNTLGHTKLLVDIIRTVALEDIDKAKDLVQERTGQLRDDVREAHLAIAEAYLARGDDQEAQTIFDSEVFVVDDEGRIFVRTKEKEESEESHYYDVFDFDGKYLARIALQAKPRLWKNQKLYTIEKNEAGYFEVVRYKVFWK